MKLNAQEQADVESFNPTMVYTMRRAAVQELILRTPYPAFWRGQTWTVDAKHIAAGIYRVTGKFEKPGGAL